MWSGPAWFGCMGKLQTPNGPLTHPDIPIISLLLRRFFTLPPPPLVLGHYSFHIHISVREPRWWWCRLMSNSRSVSPARWMNDVSGAGGSWWDPKIYGIYENNPRIRGRVQICCDRMCKICATCVNPSRKQRAFLQNICRTSIFTHTKCDLTMRMLEFCTLS